MSREQAAAEFCCAKEKECPLRGHRLQVLLTIEHGSIVHQQLLRSDELPMSLTGFIQLARCAGWTIPPPDHTSED